MWSCSLKILVWKRNRSLSPTHELWFMESTFLTMYTVIKIYEIVAYVSGQCSSSYSSSSIFGGSLSGTIRPSGVWIILWMYDPVLINSLKFLFVSNAIRLRLRRQTVHTHMNPFHHKKDNNNHTDERAWNTVHTCHTFRPSAVPRNASWIIIFLIRFNDSVQSYENLSNFLRKI